MAGNKRAEYQAEIARLTQACRKTESRYLKIDYGKRIRRMKKDLAEYDYHQREARR